MWSMTPAFAHAQRKYGPGVSDTEIKIGNTMPYSGPASIYGTMARAEAAYFRMINERGGINGRKITFISLDDAYSQAKTLEHTRKLVEHDNVLLVFSGFGTATSSTVHKYLNDLKVPQLFLISGASKWGDPAHFPWTMGWQPTYYDEGRIFARYVLDTRPTAMIGVLYQKDDYGKDYVNGFKEGLGKKASTMIVKEVTYEVTDPTIQSQIVTLRASGADVFFDVSLAKFAAQAIHRTRVRLHCPCSDDLAPQSSGVTHRPNTTSLTSNTGPAPAEMELLDRIEARLEDTSPRYRRCRFPAASKRGEDGTRRCDMMPIVAVCVYCSHKIDEKEKSVNVPGGVAHLACAQKVAIRRAAKVTPSGR